jgi:hypothetical protein
LAQRPKAPAREALQRDAKYEWCLRNRRIPLLAPLTARRYQVRMDRQSSVYLFRDRHFAPACDTVVSAAPLTVVVNVYGGGGLKGEGALTEAFGGSAIFRNDETGDLYFGVWGARNASRFRRTLQEAVKGIDVVNGQPPGRLVWWHTQRRLRSATRARS